MKNLKSATAIAAATVVAAASLTACAAPSTDTGSGTAQGSTAEYVPASYAPNGYTETAWEIILEGAAEYGVSERDAEIIAEAAWDAWNETGGDMCYAYYSMSDDAYWDANLSAAFATFDDTGEAVVATGAVYALTLLHC